MDLDYDRLSTEVLSDITDDDVEMVDQILAGQTETSHGDSVTRIPQNVIMYNCNVLALFIDLSLLNRSKSKCKFEFF